MRDAGITIPELRLPVYRPLIEDDDSSSEIEGELANEQKPRPRRRRRA